MDGGERIKHTKRKTNPQDLGALHTMGTYMWVPMYGIAGIAGAGTRQFAGTDSRDANIGGFG